MCVCVCVCVCERETDRQTDRDRDRDRDRETERKRERERERTDRQTDRRREREIMQIFRSEESSRVTLDLILHILRFIVVFLKKNLSNCERNGFASRKDQHHPAIIRHFLWCVQCFSDPVQTVHSFMENCTVTWKNLCSVDCVAMH